MQEQDPEPPLQPPWPVWQVVVLVCFFVGFITIGVALAVAPHLDRGDNYYFAGELVGRYGTIAAVVVGLVASSIQGKRVRAYHDAMRVREQRAAMRGAERE